MFKILNPAGKKLLFQIIFATFFLIRIGIWYLGRATASCNWFISKSHPRYYYLPWSHLNKNEYHVYFDVLMSFPKKTVCGDELPLLLVPSKLLVLLFYGKGKIGHMPRRAHYNLRLFFPVLL